jgi:putative FmdB family regulatory protein
MPFYEYMCDGCGKDFVLLQSISAKEEDTVCPYCSEKKSKKLMSRFSSLGTGDHSACGIGSGGGGGGWGGG